MTQDGYESDLSSDGEMDLKEIQSNFKIPSDKTDEDLFKVEKEEEQIQITQQQLEEFENQITTGTAESTIQAIKDMCLAYHSCVCHMESKCGRSSSKVLNKFKVEEGMMDLLVNFVMEKLPKALEKLLQPPVKGKKNKQKSQPPSSSSHWPLVKEHLLLYLEDILKLSESLDIIDLNYIRTCLLPYFTSLHRARDKLIVHLFSIWNSTNLNKNVEAFLCLNKLVKSSKKTLTERVLKECYYNIAAAMRSGPVSVGKERVDFMKECFSMLCQIDVEKTYNFGFSCIKKLALDYSVANREKNKEARKTVYNWQFVTCIDLWCSVLSSDFLKRHPKLKPLRHPLFEVCKHTMNLVANSKYYPLRFNVLRSLIKMSMETRAYMPLPCFILHPLNLPSFKREDHDSSDKQVDISCQLKLTQAQTSDRNCKLEIMKESMDLLLTWLYANHGSIAFPEMANPVLVRLDGFVEECQVPQYCKLVGKVTEKVREQIKFVTEERSKVSFHVTDCQAVQAWEEEFWSGERKTPLGKYWCQIGKNNKKEQQGTLVSKLRSESLKDEVKQDKFDLGFVEAVNSCQVVNLEKVKKAKKKKNGTKNGVSTAKKAKIASK